MLIVRVDSEEDLSYRVPEFARVPAGVPPVRARWVEGSWSGQRSADGWQLASSRTVSADGGDVWMRIPMVGLWMVATS